MCIFHNRTLMLWLDALKSAQQNGAWRTVFTLIIFQLLCPSLFTEYKLLYQSYGAKLMDCFCSLVAVVILSLPWNSISRETETFAAVSTFLVFYLVEVFTQLVASMRLNSLCQGKQIHGNRASYSGHAVFPNKQLPYPSPKSYGDFEVSPSLAEARVYWAMEMLLVMIVMWVRALGEWLVTFMELPGGEEGDWW